MNLLQCDAANCTATADNEIEPEGWVTVTFAVPIRDLSARQKKRLKEKQKEGYSVRPLRRAHLCPKHRMLPTLKPIKDDEL